MTTMIVGYDDNDYDDDDYDNDNDDGDDNALDLHSASQYMLSSVTYCIGDHDSGIVVMVKDNLVYSYLSSCTGR